MLFDLPFADAELFLVVLFFLVAASTGAAEETSRSAHANTAEIVLNRLMVGNRRW